AVLGTVLGLWAGNHYYKKLASDNAQQATDLKQQASDLRALNQKLIDQAKLEETNHRCAIAQNTLQANFLTRSAVDEIVTKNPNQDLRTVYVQFLNADDQQLANKFVTKLRDSGYLAPGIQHMPNSQTFNGIQLRYFKASEQKEAASIADSLRSLGHVQAVYSR